jgi:hypothetical protein
VGCRVVRVLGHDRGDATTHRPGHHLSTPGRTNRRSGPGLQRRGHLPRSGAPRRADGTAVTRTRRGWGSIASPGRVGTQSSPRHTDRLHQEHDQCKLQFAACPSGRRAAERLLLTEGLVDRLLLAQRSKRQTGSGSGRPGRPGRRPARRDRPSADQRSRPNRHSSQLIDPFFLIDRR